MKTACKRKENFLIDKVMSCILPYTSQNTEAVVQTYSTDSLF